MHCHQSDILESDVWIAVEVFCVGFDLLRTGRIRFVNHCWGFVCWFWSPQDSVTTRAAAEQTMFQTVAWECAAEVHHPSTTPSPSASPGCPLLRPACNKGWVGWQHACLHPSLSVRLYVTNTYDCVCMMSAVSFAVSLSASKILMLSYKKGSCVVWMGIALDVGSGGCRCVSWCDINPFTASARNISGLKDAWMRLQRVCFPVLQHVCFQC